MFDLHYTIHLINITISYDSLYTLYIFLFICVVCRVLLIYLSQEISFYLGEIV